MSAQDPARGRDATPAPPGRGPAWPARAGAVAGGAVIAYGVVGLVRHAASTKPGWWAVWLLAVLLAHDLLLAPAVLVAGRLSRRLGVAWRQPVRAALLVSGVLVLVTLPALLGGGRATQPGNASVLPNDYPVSLALAVALVWAVALLLALARRARPPLRGRAGRRDPPGRNETGPAGDRTGGQAPVAGRGDRPVAAPAAEEAGQGSARRERP